MGRENGHAPAELDDEDLPLDPDEAAAGAAAAADPVDETLEERVDAVIDELGGVDVRRHGATHAFAAGGAVFAAGGAVFAVLADDRLEVALDATVLKAALKTPDTAASVRGPGWIAFSPKAVDRFALDRAEAWVRFAHRRATGR
jgi:hypothetical protein